MLTKIPNQGEKKWITPWFGRSDSIQNGGQDFQLKADWGCVGSVNSVRQRIQDIRDERRPERNKKWKGKPGEKKCEFLNTKSYTVTCKDLLRNRA